MRGMNVKASLSRKKGRKNPLSVQRRGFMVGAVLGGLVLLTGPGMPVQAQDISVDVKKISGRAIVLTVQGEENVVALNSKKGIVIIDTTISSVFAALVREKIEEAFGRKDFAYVINTHFHGDHTLGNEVFSGSVIIAHENSPAGMLEDQKRREQNLGRYQAVMARMSENLEKLDRDSDQAEAVARQISFYQALLDGLGEDFVLTLPTLTFNDRTFLDLGEISLYLYYYGTSHTNSDIIIHCPEEGLWMTGDLFAPGYDPYIDSERVPFLPRWIEIIERILRTEEETFAIAPGHREFISFDELRRILAFVEQAKERFEGKESAFNIFKKDLETKGLKAALGRLVEMKGQPERWYVLHPEIDQYTYRMMLDGRVDEALEIFKVLAGLFPDSDTAFDSLGEAYMRKDQTEMAIASFKKSLELNPDNRNAKDKLKQLQIKKQ